MWKAEGQTAECSFVFVFGFRGYVSAFHFGISAKGSDPTRLDAHKPPRDFYAKGGKRARWDGIIVRPAIPNY